MEKTKGRFAAHVRGWLAITLLAASILRFACVPPARAQSASASASAPAWAPADLPQPALNAQPLAIDRGAAGLWQSLLKLHTRASLMLVTAHPDDEDGGMMTLESRGQGARAMLLTLNRGEGGQNVMSGDFWDALGLVRTEELLAADRYSNVEQYWTSVADFGFSKAREESLEQWGHDRVLADVVRVLRMTRPLIVASVFVGGPSDGHGHHSVAGQMAQEAFAAAGDPNMFPEQIRAGLRPWSPLKMYARVPSFSVSSRGIFDSATGKWLPVRFYDFIQKKWTDGLPPVNVEIPEGTYDPLLGATYLQIAREGLALQKSQNGGGAVPFAGPASVAYHRFASLVPAGDREQSYFDGVNISLAGIADLAANQDNQFLKDGLGRINALVEQALSQFSAGQSEKIGPVLASGLKETNALVAQVSSSSLSDQAKYDVLHELTLKQEQFQHAIVLALGISLQATVAPKRDSGGRGGGPVPAAVPSESSSYVVPGQEFFTRIHLDNPGSAALKLDHLWLATPPGESWAAAPESPVPASVAAGQALDQRFSVHVPENASATRPYFTRPNDEQPYYDIQDERYRSLSFAPYPVAAWAEFNYEGVEVNTGELVQTARQQTGLGMVLDPLTVVPALSVRISPQSGITPLGDKAFPLSALVHTEAEGGAKGTVRLDLPAGWRADPPSAQFSLQRAGEEQNVKFQVFPDVLQEKPYTVAAVAESGGREYREGFLSVGYPGLRSYNLFLPAAYRTSGVNVKVAPGLRVGYVTGTGDDVPQSLGNIGVTTDFLNAQDLAQGNLQKYDVIVLGVRAYAARPELATNNTRLLEYVKNGGVVIVQYNTVQYDHNYGPYPYSLPNDAERVVDETSPIVFADPHSPVLTWPNQITAKDFTGWVEERGHGFLSSWDEHYQAPIETHDPGQDPQKGGLVYARYGRGVYVYVAFALYRQLPDGVPGSFRLFANLLSLPRNPAFKQSAAGSVSKKDPATKK